MKFFYRATKEDQNSTELTDGSFYLIAWGHNLRQNILVYNSLKYYFGDFEWKDIDVLSITAEWISPIKSLEIRFCILGFNLICTSYFAAPDESYWETKFSISDVLNKYDESQKKLKDFLTNIASSQSSFKDEAAELLKDENIIEDEELTEL